LVGSAIKEKKHKNMNEFDLAELINTPKPGDYPYTLFLGAGASCSSGIPTARGMVREWQESIYKSTNKDKYDPNDFDNWVKNKYPEWREKHIIYPGQSDYSLLFSYRYKQPQERQLYIEKKLEPNKPAFGYLYLSSLIEDKRFNRILTTNFDDLVNDALRKFYDIKPIVCAFDSAISGIRVASQKPKIVKLHGDFLYNDIRSIGNKNNYSFRSLQENMEEKIEEMCKGYGLIVVGYGGNDDSIMSALKNILKSPEYLTYGLHWCLLSSESEPPPRLQELKSSHPDTIHFYYISSFDRLMEEMHIACNTKMPKVLTDPHKYNLTQEFYDSVKGGSSSKLSDNMTKHLSIFLKSMNKDERDTENYVVMEAELDWERGANVRKKNHQEAMEYFMDGYEKLSKLKKIERDPKLLINALRRKSGLCIAIAKLNKAGIEIPKSKEGRNILIGNWQEALNNAVEAVNQGITQYQQDEVQWLHQRSLIRTFPYNGCCAYSLLCEWNDYFNSLESLTSIEEEIKEKVYSFVQEIKRLDLDGDHYKKLTRDSDFHYLREKLQF